MLVSAAEMLKKAKEGHYAVGQFNINNLEWTKSVLLTAQEMAKDHRALTQGLPKCKTSADKYTPEFALICKNRSQMKKQVTKALSNKKTDVILALRKGSGIDVKDVCNEIHEQDSSRRLISYSQAVKGSYILIQLEQGK